jgi:hypothetical protein
MDQGGTACSYTPLGAEMIAIETFRIFGIGRIVTGPALPSISDTPGKWLFKARVLQ